MILLLEAIVRPTAHRTTQALRELQQKQPGLLERVGKQLATMEDIARKFPLDDPKVSQSGNSLEASPLAMESSPFLHLWGRESPVCR